MAVREGEVREMYFNIGAAIEYLRKIGLDLVEYHTVFEQDTVPYLHIRCLPSRSPFKPINEPIKVSKADPYTPRRIVKNGVATIVFWQDGTKTVVKRGSDEPESDYAAFTAALGIKVFGSNSALKRIVSRTETQEKKGKVNDPDR